MPVRPRFDKNRTLTAARGFIFAGRSYSPGDPFPHPDDGNIPDRLKARQYEARAVNMGDAIPPDPIHMIGPKGGRYQVHAPWLDKPIIARGLAVAQKTIAKLRENGPPLGWIEGGSEVTISGGKGGWYKVSAPWLDEPVNVHGHEDAAALQLEIHKAGPPLLDPVEGPAAFVLVSVEEGGQFVVHAPWLKPEVFADAKAAEERQAEIREAGPPDGWTPDDAPVGDDTAPGADTPVDENSNKSGSEQAGADAAGDTSGAQGPENTNDAADTATGETSDGSN